RHHYVDEVNFWDKVDARLAKIRKLAGGDSCKITNAFSNYLTRDRKTFVSQHDYTIPTDCDAWQQDVDDSIENASPPTLQSVAADGEGE
ncbi:hypothetical protein H0H92_001750, partial [Tricholoma furcatifolium]